MTSDEIDAALPIPVTARDKLIWAAACEACAKACEHEAHQRTRTGHAGFNAAMDCGEICRALKSPDKAGT